MKSLQKKLWRSILLIVLTPLLTTCGAKQDDLVEVLFSPSETYIIPGNTYSCRADHYKPPDVKGPFTKFGFIIKNTTTDKKLRFFFMKVTGRGSGMSELNISLTLEGTEETMLLEAGDTKIFYPGFIPPYNAERGGKDYCFEPFAGFGFTDVKQPSTVSFTWKLYFSIVNADNSPNEEPYQFTTISSSKYLGE